LIGHLECSPIGSSADKILSHQNIQLQTKRSSLSSSNKTPPIGQRLDRVHRSDTSRASIPRQPSDSSHGRLICRQDMQDSGDDDTDHWQHDHCTLSRRRGRERKKKVSRVRRSSGKEVADHQDHKPRIQQRGCTICPGCCTTGHLMSHR
jgi:hypothetical protein